MTLMEHGLKTYFFDREKFKAGPAGGGEAGYRDSVIGLGEPPLYGAPRSKGPEEQLCARIGAEEPLSRAAFPEAATA